MPVKILESPKSFHFWDLVFCQLKPKIPQSLTIFFSGVGVGAWVFCQLKSEVLSSLTIFISRGGGVIAVHL